MLSKVRDHYRIIISLLRFFNTKELRGTIISTFPNLSIYLCFFLKTKRLKIIAAEHSQYYGHGKMVRFWRKLSYRNAAKVVTLTDHDRSIFASFLPPEKVLQIPNSYSFFPAQPAPLKGKKLLSVGRLVPDKAFPKLIEAMVSVSQKDPTWKLRIIGGGELEASLHEMISSHNLQNYVEIIPPRSNIMEEYLDSDIYVCSSRTEAFPMAIIEAMTCGLSVISFDCPVGPREIITNGADGILVKEGDVQELAKTIDALINDTAKRKSLGETARKNIQRYSPEIVGKKWLSLIKELEN